MGKTNIKLRDVASTKRSYAGQQVPAPLNGFGQRQERKGVHEAAKRA